MDALVFVPNIKEDDKMITKKLLLTTTCLILASCGAFHGKQPVDDTYYKKISCVKDLDDELELFIENSRIFASIIKSIIIMATTPCEAYHKTKKQFLKKLM